VRTLTADQQTTVLATILALRCLHLSLAVEGRRLITFENVFKNFGEERAFKIDLSVLCDGSFRANIPNLKTSALKCYMAIILSLNTYFRNMYSL
jgi:hypothetical protein